MRKIRCNDEVVVISGKDKGKRGTVVRFKQDRVFVSGINLCKKHQKPNPKLNQNGGILEKEASISVSNVSIYNPSTGEKDRVGIKILEDKSRVRFFKSSGSLVDS